MMFKNFYRIICLMLIINLVWVGNKTLAIENEYILVIYDEYKSYGTDISDLNNIIKSAVSTGYKIEIRSNTSYSQAEARRAKGIIVFQCEKSNEWDKAYDELSIQNDKLLWITTDLNGLEKINNKIDMNFGFWSIDYTIKNKFSKDRNKDVFLLLDNIYPYTDFNDLINKVNYLYENGIEFFISAMGVYKNEDLDAMKRYCEVLRYCDSRGGTIIFGEPIIYPNTIDEEELIYKSKIGINNFLEKEVYPIALSTDDYSLFQEDRKKYLSASTTFFLSSSNKFKTTNFEKYSIDSFDNIILKISDEDLPNNIEMLKDVAITLDGKITFEEFKDKIIQLRRSGVTFSKATYLQSKMKFDDIEIVKSKTDTQVNGVSIKGNNFISNEELYGDEVIQSEKEDLESGEYFDLKKVNKGIFIITILGVIIFIVFFINSINIDKRKYFK